MDCWRNRLTTSGRPYNNQGTKDRTIAKHALSIEPTPLCLPTLGKERRDLICSFLNIKAFDIPKEMSRSPPVMALSYQEWWHEISATHTTSQWRTRMLVHGTPAHQVQDADNEQIGNILFQHLDSAGYHHATPLQALPPIDR